MSVLVVANGKIADEAQLKELALRADYVIAANGGFRHLASIKVDPDLVIGDLDSLDDSLMEYLKINGIDVNEHSADKDETDLELALLYAATRFESEVWVSGALGGRFDQTLGNVLLLAHEKLAGRAIRIIDGPQTIRLISNSAEIHGQAGDTVSFIPIGSDVEVVRTSGLKWPLTDDHLAFGFTRGISNLMTNNKATIEVRSGILLCVHHRHLDIWHPS